MFSQLKKIADYIRLKLGTSDPLLRSELGGKIQEINFTPRDLTLDEKILLILSSGAGKVIIENSSLLNTPYLNTTELCLPNMDTINTSYFNCADIVICDNITKITGSLSNNAVLKVKNLIIKSSQICSLSSSSSARALTNEPRFKLYVPEELVSEYQSATNWSILADRIFPLSDYYSGGENE